MRVLPRIIKDVQGRHARGRSIFLLDQCGYTDVALEQVRMIFASLPASEIILTFAADVLTTFLNDRPSFAKSLLPLELEDRLPDLLACGDGRGARAVVERLLGAHLRLRTGALYYTPFFIKPADSRRSLWFVHLSHHPTARDVMLAQHWAQANTFLHHGPGNLGMLGYDTLRDGELLDFIFDEDAEQRTRLQLLDQLPEAVAGLAADGPVTVDGFHREVANRTAATREMIDGLLLELRQAREVRLLAPTGKDLASMALRLRPTDLVALPEMPAFARFLRRSGRH